MPKYSRRVSYIFLGFTTLSWDFLIISKCTELLISGIIADSVSGGWYRPPTGSLDISLVVAAFAHRSREWLMSACAAVGSNLKPISRAIHVGTVKNMLIGHVHLEIGGPPRNYRGVPEKKGGRPYSNIVSLKMTVPMWRFLVCYGSRNGRSQLLSF